jgi:tRNA-2-methylthio-N6-dimethylallyladenosine synthase
MDERLQRLQAALVATSTPSTRPAWGANEVLVERRGKLPGQWLGKSPWLQSVHFAKDHGGDYAVGDMVRVRLSHAGPNSLSGQPL